MSLVSRLLNNLQPYAYKLWRLQGFLWGTLVIGATINFLCTWSLTKQFDLTGTPLGWILSYPLLLICAGLLLLFQFAFAYWGKRRGQRKLSDSRTAANQFEQVRSQETQKLLKNTISYVPHLVQEQQYAHQPENISLRGSVRPSTYIPVRRNPLFQERSNEFQYLEELLCAPHSKNAITRTNLVGIIGMGGIGKTSLAIELAYRLLNKQRFQGGIFWTSAAGTEQTDWIHHFATLAFQAKYLPTKDNFSHPENELLRAQHFCSYLAECDDALLILDNVEKPELIDVALPTLAGRELQCAILYTSRQHHSPMGAECYFIDKLPGEKSFHLLLEGVRPSLLKDVLARKEGEEINAVYDICEYVEYLPLALTSLRSLLVQDHHMTLFRLCSVLKEKGIMSIDEKLQSLFQLSWRLVTKEEARHLFLCASLFAEAIPLPIWFLGLSLGLEEQGDILTSLGQAVAQLRDLSLLEELHDEQVRLHSLVREFGQRLLQADPVHQQKLRLSITQQLEKHCTNLAWLEQRIWKKGYWQNLEEIQMICSFVKQLGNTSLWNRLQQVIDCLDQESYVFTSEIWQSKQLPGLFYQQLMNRCVEKENMVFTGEAPGPWIHLLKPVYAGNISFIRVLGDNKDQRINSVTYSEDGQYIAAGLEDGTICIFHHEKGRELESFRGEPSSEVKGVSFSSTGNYIAAGSDDGIVRIWDWRNKQVIQCLYGHTASVTSVLFSREEEFVLTSSIDRTARVWDWKNGKEVRCLRGHSSGVTSIALSPDGERAITSSADRTARVWDWKNGKEVRCLQGHILGVTSATFSPDGKFVLTSSYDKTSRIWNRENGEELKKLEGHTNGIIRAIFSPQCTNILTTSYDKTVRIWDCDKAREIRRLEGHRSEVRCVAFSPDGRWIVTGSEDKTTRVWEYSEQVEQSYEAISPLSLKAVGVSPDGSDLAAGFEDGSVLLWKHLDLNNPQRLVGHTNWIRSIAFSPNGSRIITGSDDQTARMWERERGEEIQRFVGHTGWVMSTVFSPDGKYVATGSYDGTVRVWDSESGHEEMCLRGHTGWIMSVAFSPDGKYVATASFDSTVRVWEWARSQEIAQMKLLNTGWANYVTFSPDGKQILVGTTEKSVIIWEQASGQEIQQLLGHAGWVCLLVFSPSGSYLISCDDSGKMFLWRKGRGENWLLAGMYQAAYRIGAIYWQDDFHLICIDEGGSSGVPHTHIFSLEKFHGLKP